MNDIISYTGEKWIIRNDKTSLLGIDKMEIDNETVTKLMEKGCTWEIIENEDLLTTAMDIDYRQMRAIANKKCRICSLAQFE